MKVVMELTADEIYSLDILHSLLEKMLYYEEEETKDEDKLDDRQMDKRKNPSVMFG